MKKKELKNNVKTVQDTTHDALQTVYDALNQGQKKKIIKEAGVKELFDRYKVEL